MNNQFQQHPPPPSQQNHHHHHHHQQQQQQQQPTAQQMMQQQQQPHLHQPPATHMQQQRPQQQQLVGQNPQQHPNYHPNHLPQMPHVPHLYPNQPQQQPPPSNYGHTQMQQQQVAHPSQQQQAPSNGKATKKATKKSLEDSILVTQAPDEETFTGHTKNREAIQKIRDAWIFKQIRLRQPEFTQYRTSHCFVGTWNVNAKGKEESLDEWLCIKQWNKTCPIPDIVAIGFQEIVDLNAVNVAVDNKTQQRSSFWIERLRYTLANSGVPYTLLTQKSMVGLLICVFVQDAHHPRVRFIQSASVGVGVLGMGGNKGGVSIRLQFYDTTICFVCSHLAAHRENVTGRNADFHNIYNKTTFDIGEDAIREVIRSGSLSQWTMGSSSVGIADHDIVFWLGDLNYRIDDSVMTERVLFLSEKGQIDEIRALDQLNVERAAGRAFANFEEGLLTFVPTYKYQPGTDVYEQRPDKKLRAPAWCDRILWMAQEDPSHVTQLSYARSETPNVSDHKAVYSMSRLVIKDVVQPKREAIYEELMRLLDRYENQSLPMVGLDRINIDFGQVRYEKSVTMPIHITNTGSVVAHYRLVPKPDENSVCKPWLKVSPMFGMIIPGEPTSKIDFTISINKDTAKLLNSGREVLDDILILRLENGRDYYLSIRATYARSCFGMSMEELVLYPQPIRTVPIDPIERAKQLESTNTAPTTTALCIPKELWRVVDAVYAKGITAPNLFIESGHLNEISSIRECLDTGSPFATPCTVHSYTDVLVSFISSLSSPVVPSVFFPGVEIDSQNIQMSARRLLEELPPIHYNVFVYIMSFFREILQHREENQLTAAKLARIACASMAPAYDLDHSNSSLQKRTGMQLIVLHLLETVSI